MSDTNLRRSGFYDSSDMASDALARLAVGARERLGSRLAGLSILSIKMRVVRQRPHMVYARPLQVTGFNGFQQDAVIDRMVGASRADQSRNGKGANGLLTLSTFAGLTGGFLRPSEAPCELERIPSESYAVMWIEVAVKGQPAREMLCVVLDDLSKVQTRDGDVVGIDYDAQMRVNNVFTLREVHQVRPSGDVMERSVIGHASDIAVDVNYVTARNARRYVQTPQTCIQQAQTSRWLRAEHGENAPESRTAESFVTSSPKPVPMTYRTPAAFIAAVGNAMTQATRLSDATYVSTPTGMGYDGNDDYDDGVDESEFMQVNQMSHAASLLNASPFKMGSFSFQQALSELAVSEGGGRTGLQGACFTWGELCAIDDRYRRLNSREADRIFTAYVPRDALGSHNTISTFGHQPRYDDGVWRGTGQMQSVAMMLGSMTLSLMFEKGIASVTLAITNEIASDEIYIMSNGFVCTIGGFNRGRRNSRDEEDSVGLTFLAAVDHAKATEDFIQRMEYDVGPEAASTGDGRYHEIYARIVADAMGEVVVHLAMDGSEMVAFPLDAPTSALWTPTLTNSVDTLYGIASVVNTLVDGTREATVGKALATYRENIRNPWGA